jgi:hypothetical protein
MVRRFGEIYNFAYLNDPATQDMADKSIWEADIKDLQASEFVRAPFLQLLSVVFLFSKAQVYFFQEKFQGTR